MQNALGQMPLPTGPGAEDPATRRACDQCRLRKVKCDKDFPCGPCRAVKRHCTSTGAGQRPKEARQRVLISSQYERKIDQIENRLGSIESLLKNISINSSLSSGEHTRSFINTPGGTSGDSRGQTCSPGDDSGDGESAFGGDSGFTEQTVYATEFLENAVKHTSLRDVSPGIELALSNLRQLVEVQRQRSISHGPRFPLQRPVPAAGLVTLALPPMDIVVSLLKQYKIGPPSLFSFSLALVGIQVDDFNSFCRDVYFSISDVSEATFAIVNFGLYNLFMEESALGEDANLRDHYLSYAKTAQANLETYLANLPLFLPSRIENVQALLLGSQYAIDLSKPTVAWHLNAMAAELCLTAGFCRIESQKHDSPKQAQIKQILFWQVYIWDHAMGLRLGRSPVIQDCDISIPQSFDYSGFLHLAASETPQLWLRSAQLQSRIYERLYSPMALQVDSQEYHRRAHELAIECRNLEKENDESRKETIEYLKDLKTSVLVDVFIKGDELQVLSTMTLVFRALPPSEGAVSRFADDCLASARRAMATHRDCVNLLRSAYEKSIYVHWNLMLTPFAPFFVLFCHVVETLSSDDLGILQEFVASIESLQDASETIEKLCRVFQIYRDVAVVYVEAKLKQQEDETMVPIGDEFDMYLSQLGFMPQDDMAMAGQANQPGAAGVPTSVAQPMQPPGGQVAQMADWFSGSRNMFGLLEEDLSQIDVNKWMQPGQ